MTNRFFLATLCTLALLATPASLTAQETLNAQQIVDKMLEANNFGFEKGEMMMTMVIQNKRGEKRTRSIRALGQKFEGLSKTRMEFIEPADVRGTTLLMHEQAGDADDLQYLFLPAFKKTKRISGSAKNGSFMGSDFTYADMESRDAEEGAKTKLPDEAVGGQDAFRISVTPEDKESDYSKVEIWIHKSLFLPLRMDFYDRNGKLLKVMKSKKIEKNNGEFVITKMVLSNKQKGSMTTLLVDKINQNASFPASVFDRNNLGK